MLIYTYKLAVKGVNPNMRSKVIIITAIGLGVAILAGLTIFGPKAPEPTMHVNQSGKSHKLTVYKSATCGCCANWVSYMKNQDYQVEVINTEELDKIKQQYDVPKSLYSCHTTIVNDGQYFVEGHIPEESVAKLLEEEPDIKGIGMAGMPAASPGMPGQKVGPFNISKVDKTGQTSQFMSL